MVNYAVPQLDLAFGAISHPIRREILRMLIKGSATVSELAAPFKVSLPAISKHLVVLEKAGLMTRRREGRIHHCELNAEPLKEAMQWLAQYETFWEGQFDSLAKYLEEGEG